MLTGRELLHQLRAAEARADGLHDEVCSLVMQREELRAEVKALVDRAEKAEGAFGASCANTAKRIRQLCEMTKRAEAAEQDRDSLRAENERLRELARQVGLMMDTIMMPSYADYDDEHHNEAAAGNCATTSEMQLSVRRRLQRQRARRCEVDYKEARELRDALAECAGHLAETEVFLADWYQSAQGVLSEDCPTDEKHCGCVSVLRAEVARLRGARDDAMAALRRVRDNLTLDVQGDCVDHALAIADSVVGAMADEIEDICDEALGEKEDAND